MTKTHLSPSSHHYLISQARDIADIKNINWYRRQMYQ